MENKIILDPWNLSQNFLLKYDDQNIIKGPCKVIKNKNMTLKIERYDIPFIIINKNNYINIETVERGLSGYKIIEISIKESKRNNRIIKIGHIENISKNELYSSSDIMILALQILYRLKVNESTLKDASFFTCSRNNFFKQKEIPTKIIKLLKSNNTFYSLFHFEPYDKTTKKNKMKEIRDLVSYLLQISWLELDEIINAGKEEINLMNEKKKNMIYNTFEIRNINKWKKYWIIIYNSWNIFKNKFGQARTPFSAFKFFDEKNNCSDFIDWLEIYSYTYHNFNKVFFYHFLNKNYEIPKIKIFNQLKELLNNVNWINYNIIEQSDTFLPNNYLE
jgi:hypothetical protein